MYILVDIAVVGAILAVPIALLDVLLGMGARRERSAIEAASSRSTSRTDITGVQQDGTDYANGRRPSAMPPMLTSDAAPARTTATMPSVDEP